MTALAPEETHVERPAVVLRPRLRAYVAGSLVGSFGALVPAFVPNFFIPWEARPVTLALSAVTALVAYALLHVAAARPEGSWQRIALARVFPGLAIGLVVLLVGVAFPLGRACAYAAFVTAGAASTLDLWEAGVLVRIRPTRVRAVGRSLELFVTPAPGS